MKSRGNPIYPKYGDWAIKGTWELDKLIDKAFNTGESGALQRPMRIEVIQCKDGRVRVSLMNKYGGREIYGFYVEQVEDNELPENERPFFGEDKII